MISQRNRQLKFLYLVYMVYWTVFSLIHKALKSQKRSAHWILQYMYRTIFSYQTVPLTACITHWLTDWILTFTQHLHSINHYQIINHINSISLMRMKVPLLVHLYFSKWKKNNNTVMLKFSAKKKRRIKWGGWQSCSLAAGPLETEPLSEVKIQVITCMHAKSFYFHQCFTVTWKQVLKSTTVMSDNVDFKPLSSLISL